MSVLKVGDKAPAFSLLNQRNETINLADFEGEKNVLLYFYPRANTPGCTTQACAIRDFKKEFEQLDTVVLGVSPDTVKKLQNFETKQSLNFDLLSDEDHKLAEAYGVWQLKKFMGRENMGVVRTSFLIDKQGRLEHIFDKFKTKNHHEVVLDYLKQR